MNAPTDRRRRVVRAAAVPVALLASAVVVWQGSYAAFSATTDNTGNSWTTGDVALTDDDGGSAAFTVTLVKPGDTGQKCIVVTDNSTVFGPVKMYAGGVLANALSGTPASATNQLNLSVQQFNPVSFTNNTANCAALTGGTSLHNGSLAALPTSYSTGVGSWTATATGQTRVYRFTWSLPATAGNTVKGQNATATFTWETQV